MAFPESPFFRPRDRTKPDNGIDIDIGSANNGTATSRFFRTPGGTTRRKKKPAIEDDDKAEHKSTVIGCASNLVNSIVGAGIVGLPFAIQQAGFVPGILLVVLCAVLTDKSLRLLIETAKHANVPSYETVAEAAYGKVGFYFVAISMFIMSYGAMLSYLMIVKDTYSSILGIDENDVLMKRTVLVIISSLVMLPLSCQRDIADLAKTSKMNVCFDLLMVLLVVYLAFRQREQQYYNGGENINFNNDNDYDYDIDYNTTDADITNTITDDLWKVRWNTIFVGLGVLSFAFVCQHSSFIIAGSLENPTKERWSLVTKLALSLAASLSLLMGISGYLGFGDSGIPLRGNILNSLPEKSVLAMIAKGLLGTTMLFVYPMESFVARHVCVVLLFEGRKAHEGDDSSVLNRRDRRITLTVVLYLIAVIPAALSEDLGNVLAITGAIGGSCLSYIGPGIVYLGIHGGQFLELSKMYFGRKLVSSTKTDSDEELLALLVSSNNKRNSSHEPIPADDEEDGCMVCNDLKILIWYLTGMPIWIKLASVGKGSLTTYVTEMALKSPHPIRIGNVRFARAKVLGGDSYTRVVMLKNNHGSGGKNATLSSVFDHNKRFDSLTTKLLRADSMPKMSQDSYKMQTTMDGTIVALPPLAFFQPPKTFHNSDDTNNSTNNNKDYQSINQKIGAIAAAVAAASSDQQHQNLEGDDIAIEDDPQGDPPNALDFVMAISYIILGIVAMFAGLASIF